MNCIKNRNIVTLFLIFFLGSCENPVVQELLRDAAVLENISVATDNLVSAYALAPMFNAETTEYTVTVPFTARIITVNGRPRRDGTVSYRMGDGETFGAETGSGVFDFPEEVIRAIVLIRVERPHMDGRTYTLTVIRGADSLLRAVQVRAGQTEAAIDSSPRPLNPGFNPETPSYTVGVPPLTKVLAIKGTIKPGAVILYEQFEEDESTPVPDSFPADPELFAFPVTMDVTKIKITVTMDGETSPPPYWLTIRRPGRVKAPLDTFTIVGGEDDPTASPPGSVKFFHSGEPVVVKAAPPFGYQMSVTRWKMGASGTAVSGTDEPLTSETDLYGFVMPEGNVIIEGNVTPITSPLTNILYVRGIQDNETREQILDEKTINGNTTDGSSWANASLNLQEMIDQWTVNTEIWISAGKVRPDWSGVTPGSGWASALTATQIATRSNWSFVLKNSAQIYGGFKGTETAKNQRNPAKYETILSGDLGERGKVKHVVVAAGVSGVRLDGLTISGGDCLVDIYDASFKINGKLLTPIAGVYGGGGGLINIDASPWLNNVIIKGNNASNGAVFNWDTTAEGYSPSTKPVLTNVTISNSTGGGIYSNSRSSLLMIGGSVSGNQGDGVFTQQSSSILINVTISGNTGYGAAYNNFSGYSQRLINLTIKDNDDGWIYDIGDVSKAVYNSVVTGNSGGSVTGNPVNSRVNGAGVNPGTAAAYWPVANGVLNTAGPYVNGGDLRVVYTRLNGLDSAMKPEIISLLEYLLPTGMGAKE